MFNFNRYRNKSFAIDLGNNNTLVADKERILLSQPSYIVFNAANNSVKAVGEEAYDMYEKTHDELKPVKPLRGGVIADYDSATRMIQALMKRVYNGSFLQGFDNIIAGVPYNTTEVERRALRDALDQFNSRNTYLLYEPVAAAIGMGLNIKEPDGKLIIDIGGGLTEIVVISLSGVAAFQSIKAAGDTFDTEIQDHFRRKYNMAIGMRTAERIKIRVGAVMEAIDEIPEPVLVKGKNMISGIPMTRRIDHIEVVEILNKSISTIELGVIQTLENCPPELAADIYQNGMFITGGGAMLRGIKQRFEKKMNLPVHIDQEPLYSVSKGIAKTLNNPKQYKGVLFE
jgi:rod shape-determining protein MreB